MIFVIESWNQFANEDLDKINVKVKNQLALLQEKINNDDELENDKCTMYLELIETIKSVCDDRVKS